jgi:phosphatidylinositol kinase/protein kinase (PI-3  family)
MLGDPALSVRYGLILEAYLLGCGSVQIEMHQKQIVVSKQLSQLANIVRQVKKEKRGDALFTELHKLRLPDSFVLPLHPSLECNGINISGCKILKSFLSPLYLSFRNADPRGEPIAVIYKIGDDLRQDILVLQMLRIMDKLWNDEGLDLKLTCYGVISTGLNEGMIEVVRNAETLGNIMRSTGSQLSVFQQDILATWLR